MLPADPKAPICYPHHPEKTTPLFRVAPDHDRVFPLEEVIQNREVTRRIAKWAVELMREGITYAPRKAIKSQVLADFVAEWTETQTPPALME
jgi:hypothetical protein